MRLLYIVGVRDMQNPGGIETYGRELSQAMAARGHAIALLETAPDLTAADRALRDQWPTPPFRQRYYLRRRFAHEDYRYHMTLRRKAAQLARAFDPDVVHSLHVYSFGAIVDSRRPVIVTVHGLEVEAIPPVVGSIQTARVVHANSTFTADLVRTRVPSPSPIEVHTWGIRQLPPAPARRSDFDLITVSRLVRRKNVDTVLRAIRAVGNLRYAVVGDGPELGALRDLSRSLGLTQVTFFGAVDEQRRHELLDSSRLFIMCPRHQEGDVEGLGLVFFEAFEHGLPVVASDKGGVPDAVGAAGLLVREPEDPDAVAGAIRTALADDTCARLKASVLERQQSHSWDRFISGFEALYVRVHRGARG